MRVQTFKIANSIAVVSTNSAYTSAIDLSNPQESTVGKLGLEIAATSATDPPDVKVEVECSQDGSNFYDPLDSSGASVGTLIASATDTPDSWTLYFTNLNLKMPSRFIRFKITGNGGNPADAELTIIAVIL